VHLVGLICIDYSEMHSKQNIQKAYDIWKLKNASVRLVYRVLEYRICSDVSLTCQMKTDSKERYS